MTNDDLFSGMYDWAQGKGKNKAFIIANKEKILELSANFSLLEIWRYLHDEQKVIKHAYSTFHRLVNKYVFDNQKTRTQSNPSKVPPPMPENPVAATKKKGPLHIKVDHSPRLASTSKDTFNSNIEPDKMFISKGDINGEK